MQGLQSGPQLRSAIRSLLFPLGVLCHPRHPLIVGPEASLFCSSHNPKPDVFRYLGDGTGQFLQTHFLWGIHGEFLRARDPGHHM